MSGRYAEHIAEHRRLSILRLLLESPGYAANDSVIQSALKRFALIASRDTVKADIAWLAEQLLIETETVEHLVVATLAQRGADVARGDAEVPGVQKPGPR